MIKNIDDTYKAELNFVDEFNLKRQGMIMEIEQEFNTIKLCFQQTGVLDKQYQPMIDRIIVMPLRKLLCEESSVLLAVCPDFKMPPLLGIEVELGDNQHLIHTPYITKKIDEWIPLNKWLEQNISWFDRDENNIAKMIPKFSYEYIIKRLNSKQFRSMKNEFISLFKVEQVEYHGEIMEVYVRAYPSDVEKNIRIYEILDKIGYNKLSLYNYIKHISDKRGAHIDVGHSLVVELVNYADKEGITPIHYFAVQMIYAAKKQVAELNAYWPEMPELICDNEQ